MRAGGRDQQLLLQAARKADGRNKGERSTATKTAAKPPLCQLGRGKGCRVLPAVPNLKAGVVGSGGKPARAIATKSRQLHQGKQKQADS